MWRQIMKEIAPIVYVVDDDQVFRRSTERIIRMAGLNVQGFSSAQDFLQSQRRDGPACLVLDVRMPGLNGMDLQRELTKSNFRIPIIFITGHGDIPMTVRAMKAGAVEFLTKPFRAPVLIDAIRSAIERDRSDLEKQLEIRELRERYNQLSPPEREVMTHVSSGLLNKEIASELHKMEGTIKFHRANVMKKMKADSLADLIRMGEKLETSI
jgi:FixJ family two-component response regulator